MEIWRRDAEARRKRVEWKAKREERLSGPRAAVSVCTGVRYFRFQSTE